MAKKPRRRRGLQFSLSSLLIVVALLSIALGPRVNRAHRQSSAVAKIAALHGWVKYDHHQWPPGRRKPFGPSWLLKWLGNDYFAQVVGVQLDGADVGDEDLAFLADLPGLQRLSLNRTRAGDQELTFVRGLRRLRYLSLCDTLVTDDAMKNVANLDQLLYLRLARTKVRGDGLRLLNGLTWLKVLDLSGTRVSRAALDEFDAPPYLVFVGLRETAVRRSELAGLTAGATIAGDPTHRCPIDEALCELTGLDFTNQPLGDVLEYCSERHDIEIVLDMKPFGERNLSARASVTVSIYAVSLGEALDSMLDPLRLSYEVRHGVLFITAAPARRIAALGYPKRAARSLALLENGAALPPRVAAALDRRGSFDVSEMTLGQFLEFLRKSHQLDIRLDEKACDGIRLSREWPVYGVYYCISLRSIVALTLDQLDLACALDGETLVVGPGLR